MEMPKEKCIEFVEDYRKLVCLWKASDPSYKDRTKREKAQQYLADKYELGSRKTVVNKIKSFRSYFHKARAAEVLKSKEDGDDPVEPGWFLYKRLQFILDAKANTSGGKDTNSQDEDLDFYLENLYGEIKHENMSEETDPQLELTSDPPSPAPASSCSENRKSTTESSIKHKKTSNVKKTFDQSQNEPFEEAQNASKRDHLSAFAEYTEKRIRNLKEPRLQAIAQMRINSLLFELEMREIGIDQPADGTTSCPSDHTLYSIPSSWLHQTQTIIKDMEDETSSNADDSQYTSTSEPSGSSSLKKNTECRKRKW